MINKYSQIKVNPKAAIEKKLANSFVLKVSNLLLFIVNVAERMDPNDEGYLEALADETELLQQRVDACRSHAQYLAFFQPQPSSSGPHESPH